MSEETVSVALHVDASPEAVFAVLTEPRSHPAIDGTGWVVAARASERITGNGQVFRMGTYHPNHPDIAFPPFTPDHLRNSLRNLAGPATA
ncbi:hypothetical protein [Pseudonocardia endophytica]|uniref:Polyketide cyclase/dehydrase/lipid transport protein n=1 Tax=Pseudonocardia endophytica TaxID=401976 RepID=A0A4V6NDJ4_PSEEN|nr:hypothetical protein [Pseudonocardia endophytica]TCK26186.1 hypothetical protein EV378_2015 [Pseudonocardia endophytica]